MRWRVTLLWAALPLLSCLNFNPANYQHDGGGRFVGTATCASTCQIPAPTCRDGSTRITSRLRACDERTCQFLAIETPCANGCVDGRCVAEPCAGQTCDDAVAPVCLSDTTLRVRGRPGFCNADGACGYISVDLACAGGCTNGVCGTSPCLGVSCETPPPSVCVGNALRVFDRVGLCDPSSGCQYTSRDIACPGGCSAAACNADLCTGVTCDAPAAPACVSATARRVFAPGTCSQGLCRYAESVVSCAAGEQCQQGVCVSPVAMGGGSAGGGSAAGGGSTNGGGSQTGGGSGGTGGGSAGGGTATGCALNHGGCSANASCSESGGQVTCTCMSGYVGDGQTCANWHRLNITGPSGRRDASLTWDDARHRVTLFGGSTATGQYSGDTWVFDGASWSNLNLSGPSARANAAMTYDSDRQVIVVFGGEDSNSSLGDTWEFDGASWAQKSTTGPTARTDAQMAYDPVHHQVVMYGGIRSADRSTWSWSGSAWSTLATAGPTTRSEFPLVWDDARHTVFFWGGTDLTTSQPTFTGWEWNGSGWTDTTPTNTPLSRYGHAMAYHPGLRRVVMFGGMANSVYQHDTWLWSGTWVEAPLSGPGSRQGAAMATDALHKTVVLFGGDTNTLTLGNDTWVLGE